MTEPSDVISFKGDRRRGPGDLPRRMHIRAKNQEPSPPTLWNAVPTEQFPAEENVAPELVFGQYPKGFIAWAAPLLRAAPTEILHLCSGSLPPGQGRFRVDIRPGAAPDVIADARRLPFPDKSFRAVMIDPPYSVEYAEGLYEGEYPRPKHLLEEAARVLKPCGRMGLLHFFVANPPPGCRIEQIRGITTGGNFRIRAFMVFEREQDGLFESAQGAA